MKYIGYCRKSTDEKDKQVLSIDQQLSELKEFAEKEKIEIVDFLTEAQTAKVTGRPIFNSLIKRIEKGEAQGIVSWNPDRLARNSVDGGKIIYLLDTGELQSLKFPTHWFENTPQGRFMLSIAFGQAKYYVDNLSQNVHRGLKYKIKTGVWPARAPMGYRNDRNSKSIVMYEPEARPLRKAFELYSTGKYALDDIGSFLFENGMKNKYSGGQLNDSNLRRVLMRPFYTGYMVFRGEMFKGTHTPLISKELFDKCQIVRKQRGYFHQVKSKRYDFAFTGLIKCKYCNCSITAEHRPFFFPRTNHKADYIYYHCTKKKGECCQKGYTREEILEVQFREIIKTLSVSKAWADQMNNFLVSDIETQKVEDKNKSVGLETEISQTEQKLDTLLEAYLDIVVDSESYIKKKNELMERKQNLVSIQKQLSSDNPNWIEGVKEFIDCAQKCAKIARAENNCHDLSDMAKKVGSKYFLKDNTIEFCLNFPYKSLAANGGAASHPSEFVPTFASYQSEGLTIYGLLTVPTTPPPAGGFPVIIFNHGYIAPATYVTTERYVTYVDAFARNGYIVFKPDYRGHGKSEGKPEGAYYSPAYATDVLNALATLKRYKVADQTRIGMWGHSMGGNIIVRDIVVNTSDVKAVVIWGGVIAPYDDLLNNWHRKATYQPPPQELANRNNYRKNLTDQYGTPETNPTFWKAVDPLSYISDITTPIQLHTGELDEEVPPEFSASLYEKLILAGKTAEYYIYPGGDHNIDSPNFESAMERSIEFFDRYLK